MIRSRKATICIALCVVALNSCALNRTARIVRTESGTLSSLGVADIESDALLAALDQAYQFCSHRNQVPVFAGRTLEKNTEGKTDIENFPTIGRVVSSDEQQQILMEFECRQPA